MIFEVEGIEKEKGNKDLEHREDAEATQTVPRTLQRKEEETRTKTVHRELKAEDALPKETKISRSSYRERLAPAQAEERNQGEEAGVAKPAGGMPDFVAEVLFAQRASIQLEVGH